jgi:hypothetical protein
VGELFSHFIKGFESFFSFGGEFVVFSGRSLKRFDSDIFQKFFFFEAREKGINGSFYNNQIGGFEGDDDVIGIAVSFSNDRKDKIF